MARSKLPFVWLTERGGRRFKMYVDETGLRTRPRAVPIPAPDPRTVQAVVELLRLRPAEPTRYAAVHSYRLKHIVEAVLGCYVSNGAAILAFHLAGIPLEQADGPNAWVRIPQKWIKQFSVGADGNLLRGSFSNSMAI